MSTIERNQKRYFQTLINATINLRKRHNEELSKIMEDTFYYDNYTNVVLKFTDKGKLLDYKFIHLEED